MDVKRKFIFTSNGAMGNIFEGSFTQKNGVKFLRSEIITVRKIVGAFHSVKINVNFRSDNS